MCRTFHFKIIQRIYLKIIKFYFYILKDLFSYQILIKILTFSLNISNLTLIIYYFFCNFLKIKYILLIFVQHICQLVKFKYDILIILK